MREAYLSHVRKWDAEFRKEPIFEGLVKLPAQFLEESHSRSNFLKWPSLSKVLNGSAAPPDARDRESVVAAAGGRLLANRAMWHVPPQARRCCAWRLFPQGRYRGPQKIL
jgi:hypothetical protein